MSKYTANQDIRDYMADHGVTQKMLAEELGVSIWTVCTKLKTELCQKDKEVYLNIIDSLAESTPHEEVTENLKRAMFPVAPSSSLVTESRFRPSRMCSLWWMTSGAV